MIDARNAMAPKRHGGPAQPAGKGHVKSSEPPDDVPFEEASEVTQQQASDATVSASVDSAPEMEPTPELESMPEPEPVLSASAEILPPAVPAPVEVPAPAVAGGAVSASASLIGSVAGGLGLAALLGGGLVVVGLGAALGAWHSVALANSYLSRR
jgi:hypothetical protein